MPEWQQGPGVRNTSSNGKRQTPDVAVDADPVSGLAIYVKGQWGQGSGTSQASPIWVGMTALLNQYLKTRGLHGVGFFNPALYTLASGSQPYPPLHDIVLGSNLAYVAAPGYDLATGLGSPDAFNLARDLEARHAVSSQGMTCG
jgi:subtilase family serine protease